DVSTVDGATAADPVADGTAAEPTVGVTGADPVTDAVPVAGAVPVIDAVPVTDAVPVAGAAAVVADVAVPVEAAGCGSDALPSPTGALPVGAVAGTQNTQSGGAGGQLGSGAQPGGGTHPSGGCGQPGGGLNFQLIVVPFALAGASAFLGP